MKKSNERPSGRTEYMEACALDRQAREREAVAHYERAIALGLSARDLRGALLGLGSTYRCLGAYRKAVTVLQRGHRLFPRAREFDVFLAMALHNTGRHREAMKLLLPLIAETSADEGVRGYRRAIMFYATRLERRWGGKR